MTFDLMHDDFSSTVIDAMSYELYIKMIVPLLEQELSDPDTTDEELNAVTEKIIAMAKLSHYVASVFDEVQNKIKNSKTKESSD
jgi:hypothetical protein